MGGSVTLFSMLFIVLTGYWFGVRTGITTAVAYGILQLLINPVHYQYLADVNGLYFCIWLH